MHDCFEIKDRLFDFVFDELTPAQKTVVVEHTQICAHCRAELVAAQETLLTFDDCADALEPTAREWQVYETKLLKNFEPRPQNKFIAAFKRILLADVRIPAPVFAAGLLLFTVAAFFAARSFNAKTENAPTAAAASNQTIQTVEKPTEKPAETAAEKTLEKIVEKVVVREKVVKQIVFVERKNAPNAASNRAVAKDLKTPDKANAQINLAEFKPIARSTPSVEKVKYDNEK